MPLFRFGYRPSPIRAFLLGTTLVAGALLVAPAPQARAQSLVGDENGPKVRILAPAYQDVLKGKTRVLIGIVAGQYNPSTIEFWVDDRLDGKPISLTSMASMSFVLDTHRFSDGPHKLTVRATDTQGFRGQKDVSIYINNHNKRDIGTPDVKWKNLAPFQQLAGQPQIELDTKTSLSVKWIIVKVAPADKGNTSPVRSWILGGGETKFNFDTTKVADGIYTVTAEAYDALEQKSNAPGLTVGVVNSPINATTVGESLDGLRQMAQVEKSKLPGVITAPPAWISPLKGKVSSKNPVASAKVAPSKSPATNLGAAPSPGVLGQKLEPLFVPQPGASKTSSKAGAQTKRIAKAGQNGSQTSVALSKPKTGVTPAAPIEAEPETPKDKTFVARLSTPEALSSAESASAQLSAPADGSAKGAISLPQSAAPEAPAASRIEIARLALPSNDAALEVAPVLSASRGFESVASSGSAVISSAQSRVAAALVASAPEVKEDAPRRASQLSKVVVSRQGADLRIVDRAEKPRLTTELPVPTTSEVAPVAVPELSATGQPDAIAQSGKTVRPSKLAKIAPRISALPSRKNATGEGAMALRDDEHPAITVSPVQAVFNAALPKQHLVKTETTLRALAAHYGLPVDMVAAANNWNANMRVIPGMVVLLPQQVQLSYNGHKVGGDVSSMLIGDTTVTALRFLFEQNGGKLDWDAAKQEVTARKGASTIHIKIGSKVASVDNKQVMMQLAAFLFEGRTMVPARFFEEGLHAQVEWNPETGHLVVAMVG